ncbi:VanZ family protein [Prolixibacter denitrificans]|jgi:VanZ family protein|uniref:Membrane protein n=1 Tax=Prolixibacter denitrificans TaxID=1541063 RepID=A0A2P8CHG4_9BACT|nr:VanZ family protein [Prolixibacter denitrificans]PSK84376.1 VanZ like protein [Prolixibacter denitrificans]GET20551.1 membrane protein [Prolixibacter denitrificans]
MQKYIKIIGWFIVILYLTLTPAGDIPKLSLLSIPYFDKVVHFTMYFVMSMLLAGYFHQFKKYSNQKILLINALLLIFIGGLLEILQYELPINRDCSWGDFAANTTGAITGTLIYLYWLKNTFVGKWLS